MSTEKFALLEDLGIITVPDDYNHATRLESFVNKNREHFFHVDGNITDNKFSNPSRILKCGDQLWVSVFKQIVRGNVTFEEHMEFLATRKAVHTGAQGISLVFDQKRDQFPRCVRCVSFDVKEHLWVDAHAQHMVPFLDYREVGGFGLLIDTIKVCCFNSVAFFCFTEVE